MSRWLFVVIALAGCQRTYDEQQAARGSGSGSAVVVVAPKTTQLGQERGDCKPDNTCDAGLMCLSGLCVRPPAADCGAVAEQLASLELGNYAPKEQRAPLVADKRAACEKAMISKDEGKCIAAAHDKFTMAGCAPRMFPEVPSMGSGSAVVGAGGSMCVQVANKLRALIATSLGGATNPDMVKTIDAATGSVRDSCEQDGWPLALQQCMLAANTEADMKGCEPLMPAGLQQKLQNRMMSAMRVMTPTIPQPPQPMPPPPPSPMPVR